MLAVVRKPHTNFRITGDVPRFLLVILKERYGDDLEVKNDAVSIFETDWYKNIKKKTTPGDNLHIYRKNHGWTQKELGLKLGGFSKQHISEMELNKRSISKKTAKNLAELFSVSVEKFI